MKKIGKFSVGNFKSYSINRRSFLVLLFASACFSKSIISQAKNGQSKLNGQFYWLDLKTGIVSLPANQEIDIGQPGSIMKLVSAAAILEENLPSASKIFDCRGAIIVNGQHYICRYPHGRISLVEAIGQSCNVFFAKASSQVSSICFLHYLKKFGLGHCFDGETVRASKISSASLILGLAKEFRTSAIDILQLVALIAKRGKLSTIEFNCNKVQKLIFADPEFREHTWSILQTGMHIACQRGTAKNLDKQNKLHIAAKTGTTVHGNTFQSWLAGYFPDEDPRYVFCLRANAGTSYDRAVPLAKRYLFSKDWSS